MGAHVCTPVIRTLGGGDHTGLDAFMRCACGRRTINHIECHSVTPEVERLLKIEWRKRTQPKADK